MIVKNICRRAICFLIFSSACLFVFAQTENTNMLQQQFVQYQSQHLQEKIFAHTDKTFYLAGETVWFKIYDVDGYFLKPLTLSAIAYAELINKDQRQVLQTKVDIQRGKGNGSISIPSSIPSGNYIFRVYTNWMKNFSPDFYFEQPITIINTVKAPESKEIISRKAAYSIQFFPEGGNLVYDLSSKIAFKAVNQNGEGVACSGFVINQKKDTLSRFKTLRFGMGNFLLTPHKGDTCSAIIKINDSVFTQQLPAIYDQGYTISLEEQDNDKIKIAVRSNILIDNPFVYLFIQARQLVKEVKTKYISDGEAVFYLDKKNMSDGISHITIFNAKKLPVCERLYFKQPVKKMLINIEAEKTAYTTQNKVDIKLAATDQSGLPAKADLSMSVFQIDSLQNFPEENILNYLLLTSDLKGGIESPQYYFENNDAVVNEAADNLMLTQGWSRFRWEDILQNKKPLFEFLPETEGFLITGKITGRKNNDPQQNQTVYLTIPGNHFELSSDVSKASGLIRFNVKKFYGKNEIILQTNNQTDSSYRIDISNPFSDKFSQQKIPDLSISKNQKSLLTYHSINTQAENSYLVEKKHIYHSIHAEDTILFYGKPDLQYNLDNYTRFITMEEVMREYVTDVRIRKQSDKFNYRVRNTLFNTFFEDAPLILIDGLPVFDATKIIAVDPLKIKKIDIISHKYYLGSLVNDGIVSYQTYNGDLAGYELDPGAIVLQYEGVQQQKEFYTPVYDTKQTSQTRIPDFRTLLQWSPEITTGNDGKKELSFYTSELTGKFAILVEGITAEGLPGYKILSFTVSK